jgi:SAM-dependent methyltransferase
VTIGRRGIGTGPPIALRRETPCKVCGTRADYAYSIDNGTKDPRVLYVFSCNYCRLLFVGNRITEDQLARAYTEADTTQYYEEVGATTEEKALRSIEDLQPLLRCTADPSVLDVGCGYGHFLQALRARHPSIRAIGTELPGDCADFCRSKGLTVFTCELKNIPEKISVAVLLDVAEHVPQPNRTFAACFSLLEAGGYIYIHTPRRCFWDSLFLGLTRVPGLRGVARTWLRSRVSIQHLHLWTDKALELSLKKAGFRTIYLKKELELSWPLEKYTNLYLGKYLGLPPLLVGLTTLLANLLFVRLGILHNKAIYLGQKASDEQGLVRTSPAPRE